MVDYYKKHPSECAAWIRCPLQGAGAAIATRMCDCIDQQIEEDVMALQLWKQSSPYPCCLCFHFLGTSGPQW